MSLFQEIKKRKIQAMREKDVIVKGVIDDILTHQSFFKVDPNDVKDEDVIAVMDNLKTKFESAIEGVLNPDAKHKVEALTEENPFVVQNRQRIAFLTPYIPVKMTEEEMVEVVNSLDFNNIGQYQGYFGKNYDKNFIDRSMLTAVVKRKLGM